MSVRLTDDHFKRICQEVVTMARFLHEDEAECEELIREATRARNAETRVNIQYDLARQALVKTLETGGYPLQPPASHSRFPFPNYVRLAWIALEAGYAD